jgi:hypothetical protein
VLIAPLTAVLLGGCAGLLPTARQEVVSPWISYQDAVQALATFAPYEATREDVHKQGLNPHLTPMVTVLHFADVLKRFSPALALRADEVDRGISHCLGAGKRCTGYAISVRKVTRQRVGNFWLDSLNFQRNTVTSGWSVEALLVFVDDALVYELVGGQPTITDHEETRNPLGPLQTWGNRLAD